MVKKLILVLIVSLMLCGCSLLFYSPFPAYLPLVTEVADLSGKVGGHDWCEECYRVFYLNGYVFVLNNSDDVHILDEDLNYIKKGEIFFNDPQRLGVYGPGTGYIFGNDYYNDDAPAFTPNAGLPYMFDTHGYYDPVVSGNGIVTLRVNFDGINNLLDFGGDVGFSVIIPPEIWEMANTSFDPDNQKAYIFLRYEDDRGEVLVADSADIAVGGPLGTLGEYPFGYPLVRLPRSDFGRYYYTRDGFVAVSRGDYKLCSLKTGETIKSISGINNRRSACDFDIDGEFFYVYDGESKKVYKCKTWWQR
jgi:hypothetical protein